MSNGLNATVGRITWCVVLDVVSPRRRTGRNGRALRNTVGRADGDTVGRTLGNTVGRADGDTVGRADGDTVGRTLGNTVGSTDGDTVGRTLGNTVRSTDRNTVGRHGQNNRRGDVIGFQRTIDGTPHRERHRLNPTIHGTSDRRLAHRNLAGERWRT